MWALKFRPQVCVGKLHDSGQAVPDVVLGVKLVDLHAEAGRVHGSTVKGNTDRYPPAIPRDQI